MSFVIPSKKGESMFPFEINPQNPENTPSQADFQLNVEGIPPLSPHKKGNETDPFLQVVEDHLAKESQLQEERDESEQKKKKGKHQFKRKQEEDDLLFDEYILLIVQNENLG